MQQALVVPVKLNFLILEAPLLTILNSLFYLIWLADKQLIDLTNWPQP